MPDKDNMSDWLIEYLNAEQSKEEIQEINILYKRVMESVEGLCSGTNFSLFLILRQTGTDRELLEGTLDSCFCHILVKQIPTMVSRALRLEPVVVDEISEGPVNIYLREATRAYLLGLFVASAALSRSALEQALEEKVPKRLQTDSKEEKLKKLIKAAELSRLLQDDLLYLADQTRKAANKVVHGKPCDESGTFDILIKTREVVRSLYSRSKKPNAPHRSSQK